MRSGLGAFAAVGGRGIYGRSTSAFDAVRTDASKEGFDEARIGESGGACGAIVVDCEAEELSASRVHFNVKDAGEGIN